MRLVHAGQRAAHQGVFTLQVLVVQVAAHVLEPEIHEPGIQYICLAVIANFLDATL